MGRRQWVTLLSLFIMGVALLSGVVETRAQGAVTVALSPVSVGVGEVTELRAEISCPLGCAGFKATLSFDRALLRVESARVGPYLGPQVFEAVNTVDNAAGQVELVAVAMAAPPAGTANVLFTLSVSGLVPGSAAVSFDNLEITGLNGSTVTSTSMGTTVSVYETGIIPFFSPPDDRWQLAFTSERDGNPEVYVINADGSNPRRLTDHPASDSMPDWSPGGDQIAFVSARDGNPEIYVMNADGSGVQRLTDHPSSDLSPAWTPNGRIAFVSERDGNPEIYVMNADGSNVERLTNEAAADTDPAWSPDGSKLAFISARGGAPDVYTMREDGSDLQQVTNQFGANGWYPAWAPGGTRLTFTSERDSEANIYRMSSTGTDLRQLTERSGWLTLTDWSPDGEWIAFMSGVTGFADLYVMDADGTRWFRITEETSADYEPDWRPVAVDSPCLIRTSSESVLVYVGPGRNRGIFGSLPANRDFTVTGQAVDSAGNLWWRLNKDEIRGGSSANSLWVAADDVEEIGGCGGVPPADTPPIIPGGDPTPPPGWGPCGSCQSCGGPADECVLSPEGQCLWDPTFCSGPGDRIPGDNCYILTTIVDGNGTIYVLDQENCPNGSGYTPNSLVGLYAQPGFSPAYVVQFTGWTSNCPLSSYVSETTTVTMDANCTVVAHFK